MTTSDSFVNIYKAIELMDEHDRYAYFEDEQMVLAIPEIRCKVNICPVLMYFHIDFLGNGGLEELKSN